MDRYLISIFVFLFLLSSCAQVVVRSPSPEGGTQTPLPGETPTGMPSETQPTAPGGGIKTPAVGEEILLPSPVLKGDLHLTNIQSIDKNRRKSIIQKDPPLPVRP